MVLTPRSKRPPPGCRHMADFSRSRAMMQPGPARPAESRSSSMYVLISIEQSSPSSMRASAWAGALARRSMIGSSGQAVHNKEQIEPIRV